MTTLPLLRCTELGNPKSAKKIIFLHGWPDRGSEQLFQRQIASLSGTHRIYAIDIPGYEPEGALDAAPFPLFGYSLAQLTDMLHATIQKRVVCDDDDSENKRNKKEKPIFVCHDWGAVIFTLYAKTYGIANFSKCVMLDISPVDSRSTMRQGLFAVLVLVWYQLTAAFMFWLPRCIGDPLARRFAKVIKAPHPETATARMGYMYVRMWANMLTLTMPAALGARPEHNPFAEYANPDVPMLFLCARKPLQFHTQEWLDFINNSKKNSKAVEYRGAPDHWFMTRGPDFQEANAEFEKFVGKN